MNTNSDVAVFDDAELETYGKFAASQLELAFHANLAKFKTYKEQYQRSGRNYLDPAELTHPKYTTPGPVNYRDGWTVSTGHLDEVQGLAEQTGKSFAFEFFKALEASPGTVLSEGPVLKYAGRNEKGMRFEFKCMWTVPEAN